MPLAPALPSSWVFSSRLSCFCLPCSSTGCRTISAFLTGLPFESLSTVRLRTAVGVSDFPLDFCSANAEKAKRHAKTATGWNRVINYILQGLAALDVPRVKDLKLLSIAAAKNAEQRREETAKRPCGLLASSVFHCKQMT